MVPGKLRGVRWPALYRARRGISSVIVADFFRQKCALRLVECEIVRGAAALGVRAEGGEGGFATMGPQSINRLNAPRTEIPRQCRYGA